MNKFVALFAIMLPVTESATAATATGAMTVKATVTSSCVLNTSATGTKIGDTSLDFGSISSLAANVNASSATTGAGAVNVLCNKGTAWNLTFGTGDNAASGQRNMKGGAGGTDLLPYNLYSDSGYKTKIETATAFTGTGTGTVQSTQVFGQIPAGTVLPSVGSYLDTVTLTVTY
ncbi:Csu type fimbrial protein [Acinetobacter boissieri]|uniref:Spore coat protein U (SCPU) domain-containing protein n=1 Tax=Acinetobacter boissieri TaxID=1219383 RepID=A0A1G6HA25_9GAMM|nr:spore coat U domain-containing protein [Acinetobacter boissieri]SDB91003.1 Spore coat protein U (SCPU) domain-containing protein [Acinetobacter boissieri]